MVFLTIVIALICVLLMLVVLIQNPKGGGLDATFGGKGATQVLGAARSTDFMEKLTWYLAAGLIILCLVSSIMIKNAAPSSDGVDIRTGGTGFNIEYVDMKNEFDA